MKKIRPAIVVALLLQTLTAFAVQPVKLEGKEDFLIGGDYIEIFEDASGKYSFDYILQNNIPFKTVSGNFSATQNSNSVYWIRFKIDSLRNPKQKWILEILDSRQDKILFYQPTIDNNYSISESGIGKGFSNREFRHKNFVFDIHAPLADKYYYLQVQSTVISSLLFKIRSLKEFSQYGFNEYYMLGIYYGILSMMIIFSVFLFLTLKEKLYLHYSMYAVLWIFISMMKDGMGFQYLWSKSYYVSIVGYYLSKPLLLIAFILYSFEFLSFSMHPRLKKMIIGLCVFYILYYSASVIFEFTFIENILFHVPLAVVLYTAILNYREGYKPARYFILGNSIVLLSLIVEQLRDAGVLAELLKNDTIAIIAVYSTNISMVLEIIILAFAMADRVKFLKKEKEETQQLLIEQLYQNQEISNKVNTELETKVKERTKLLEEANEKLQQQAEEINKMNALLDKDNWNLKKNIIEQKESRIIMKNTGLDDFLQVYPDEAAAFHYLDQLKWSKGFSCIKCGNDKYGPGAHLFSRRCTKCRHDESVTANTIFYKCKFPIHKALYIVTVINRDGDTVSISELAQQLGLRYATCWAFAKKVQEVRSKPRYSGISNDDKLSFLIMES